MLPITMLESMLHNTSSKPGMPAIIDDYIIQIGDELVTIKELIDFWKVGHEKLKKATASMNEALAITEKYLGGKKDGKQEETDKSCKGQEKLQVKPEMEGLQKKKVRHSRRKGLHNSEAAD